jgi:CRP-like cAMP-binding protein
VVDTPVRIAFLKKIHLFYGLGDDELSTVADQLEEYAYAEESTIFEQNTRAESFYLIYVGSVKIVRRQEGKEIHLATFVSNDYFGEMALIEGRPRSGTATTLTDTLLFVLPQQNFNALIKEMPRLLANLNLDIQSRKLARSLRFRWLLPEEVIYFLARKHIIVLYKNLILPALVLSVPAFLIYAFYAIAPLTIALFAGIFSLVGIVLWVIWLFIDWTPSASRRAA